MSTPVIRGMIGYTISIVSFQPNAGRHPASTGGAGAIHCAGFRPVETLSAYAKVVPPGRHMPLQVLPECI